MARARNFSTAWAGTSMARARLGHTPYGNTEFLTGALL